MISQGVFSRLVARNLAPSLLATQTMCFGGKIVPKHKQYYKMHGERQDISFPKETGTLATIGKKRATVTIKKILVPIFSVRSQPVPIKDYMNFKQMESGSEVLFNLENYKNFTDSELVGGMIELNRRAKGHLIDWSEHPIVSNCLRDLRLRQPRLNSKNIAQV